MRSNWRSRGCRVDTSKPEELRHSQQHDHVDAHEVPSNSFSIFPKHVRHVHGLICSCQRTQPGKLKGLQLGTLDFPLHDMDCWTPLIVGISQSEVVDNVPDIVPLSMVADGFRDSIAKPVFKSIVKAGSGHSLPDR